MCRRIPRNGDYVSLQTSSLNYNLHLIPLSCLGRSRVGRTRRQLPRVPTVRPPSSPVPQQWLWARGDGAVVVARVRWLRTPLLQPDPCIWVQPGSKPSGCMSLAGQGGKSQVTYKRSHPFPSWAWEAFRRSPFMPCVLQGCHIAPLLETPAPNWSDRGRGASGDTSIHPAPGLLLPHFLFLPALAFPAGLKMLSAACDS